MAARSAVKGTQATGSPVGVQDLSAAELAATYEGLMAEYRQHAAAADRQWSEFERVAVEADARVDRAWQVYAQASRRRQESWDAARAAFAAWNSAADSGQSAS